MRTILCPTDFIVCRYGLPKTTIVYERYESTSSTFFKKDGGLCKTDAKSDTEACSYISWACRTWTIMIPLDACFDAGSSIAQRGLRLPVKYPVRSRLGRGILGGRPRGMVLLLPPCELQRDAGEIRGKRRFPVPPKSDLAME